MSQFATTERSLGQFALPFADERESLEDIFSSAHLELRPRTALPRIRVRFFPFAGINHTARLNEGQLTVRISDLFDRAPACVHRALALILLAKLYKKKIDPQHNRTYRAYILQSDIQERARVVRTTRGRKIRMVDAQGRHFDLESMFVRLNREYFSATLEKPALSWSAKRSRYILGRYDSTRQAIFISRVLDSAKVPAFVIEYVMFHEMLHVKHQTRIKDCRMVVHTPEFKREERTFAKYSAAKAWLKEM